MYTICYINVTNEQCTRHSCEFSASTILNSIAHIYTDTHTRSRNFYAQWNTLLHTFFFLRISFEIDKFKINVKSMCVQRFTIFTFQKHDARLLETIFV